VAFGAEIEAVSFEGSLEPVSVIDEKHGVDETLRVSYAHQKSKVSGEVVDIVFLAKFSQEDLSQRRRIRRKLPDMKEVS
jgi:hypothetical protein